MRSSKTIIAMSRLGMVLGVLALGGCSAEEGRAVANDALPHNDVQTVPERLTLAFAAGSSSLSDNAARQLREFLARADVQHGDSVGVAVSGNGALDQQRRAAVADRLLTMGYKPAIADALQSGPVPLGSGPVTVTAYRFLVVPPNCPDWSGPTHVDWQSQRLSNIGCATETDLALMIANPRDLIQGRSSPYASSDLAAGSIERYRADKTTPLNASVSTGSGS